MPDEQRRDICRLGSRNASRKLVAKAPDRKYKFGLGWVFFDLLAQLADQYVDTSIVVRPVALVQLLHDLIAT